MPEVRPIDGNDLIRRKDAEKALESLALQVSDSKMRTVAKCVNALHFVPAVDAVPVVHGRVVWKNRFMGGFVPDVTITDKAGEKHTGVLDTTHYEPVPYCSECGKELGVSSLAYCPNCGAKMDGGAEDANRN